MSVTSEADYSRSMEVLLRHGFVVQQCVSTEKFRCPSPAGPVQQYEQDEAEDDGYGMRRVASERSLRSRRSVTWDLSIYDRIPPLPFRNKNNVELAQSSSSQHCNSPSRCIDPSSDKLLPRRSSHKTVAVDLSKTTREYDPSAKKGGVISTSSVRPNIAAVSCNRTRKIKEASSNMKQTEMFKQEVLSKKQVDAGYRSYNGYRDDYYLGDLITSASHMVIESTPERAIQAVDVLQTHDFAWIKRSNGRLYTYAILANRSSSRSRPCASTNGSTTTADSDDKEYMYFVLNDCGATKMVYKNNWSKCIRFVNGTN